MAGRVTVGRRDGCDRPENRVVSRPGLDVYTLYLGEEGRGSLMLQRYTTAVLGQEDLRLVVLTLQCFTRTRQKMREASV